MRIVFIDNNKLYKKILFNKLNEFGYETIGFSEFEEAKPYLEENKGNIDFLFLGNSFKNGKNGFDISELVHKIHKEFFVILLTSDFGDKTFENAENAGVKLILPKEIVKHIRILIDYMELIIKKRENDKKESILIIDNHISDRKQLKFLLEGVGYHVNDTGEGQKAFELATKMKPNYIIIDISLKDIDGLELCEQFKLTDKTYDIPVIINSSIDSFDIRQKAFNAGAVDFFTKENNVSEIIGFFDTLDKARFRDKNSTCLLIEDSRVQVHVVTHLLMKIGVQVIPAENIEEATSILEKHVIDIIICDLYLENRLDKVFNFIKSVKKDKEDFIPLIVVSVSSKKEDLINSMKCGANDYIQKPYIEEELIHRVQNNLNLKKGFDNLKIQNENLHLLAIKDGLTDAYNRNYFDEIFQSFISRYNRKKIPFSVIMVDIDNFKDINDNFGHNKGDEVLKAISNAFRTHIRPSDILFRFGGDEFVVLLDGAEEKDIDIVCSRVKRNIVGFSLNDGLSTSHKVDFSYGSAQYKGQDIKEFLDMIDKKMYKNKRSKK